MTVIGLVPAGCMDAECGHFNVTTSTSGQSAAVLLEALRFPFPGRYTIRAEAGDPGSGQLIASERSVLVYKAGDTTKAAPCCRYTSLIVGPQLGRPIDRDVFRGPAVSSGAQALGWSDGYLRGADLESERLFDYGSALAPRSAAGAALRRQRCPSRWLAGPGSPAVYGARGAPDHGRLRGFGKQLVFVPAGANASADEVACQSHWTGWQRTDAYPSLGSSATCSTGCTRQGTLRLIQEAGALDFANQALIAATSGRLSLNPAAHVLDALALPPRPDPALLAPDNLSYYEAPATRALAAAGLSPWSYLVLTPVVKRFPPAFPAWTSGGARGSVIAQCYPELYYATHEIGHQLGFAHSNVYAIDVAGPVAAPVSPLAPGAVPHDGYTDALDLMACCRSDLSLYHRSVAGWLEDEERAGLGSEDAPWMAATDGEQRQVFTLWPFDRLESRGRLQSLSLWRSRDEILLLGLRDAAHWQESTVQGAYALTGPAAVAPEQVRSNVAGLAVEYIPRRNGTWGHKGLLDFNLLSGDWPAALPNDASGPRYGCFLCQYGGRESRSHCVCVQDTSTIEY